MDFLLLAQTATALGVIFFLGFLGKRVTRYAGRKRLRATYGCKEPNRLPQRTLRLGTDFLRLYQGALDSGRYAEFWRGQHRAHGRTVRVDVLGEPWLVTCDPQNIAAVHAKEASNFVVGPLRKQPLAGWIGDGIFASDGDKWKVSRALTKSTFSRVSISQLDKHEVHVQNLLSRLPDEGQTVDLQPLLKRVYLDTSTELLFGRSANSLLDDPAEANFDIEEFESCFEKAMTGAHHRIHASILAGGDSEWKRAYRYVHSVFDAEIDAALQRLSQDDKMGADRSEQSAVGDLISYSSDRIFLRDQLLNIFIGAKDTAAIGIADLFFHLARHPQVWSKLRAEVLAIEGTIAITFELLKSLKYLQAVLNESLRLLSPVERALRVCSVDTILPKGGGKDGASPVLVTKGTRVETTFNAMHYERDIWGPDVETFRPERWEGGLAMKWEYVPFLGGARMCPAQQMMLTQYGYTLLRFAQNFARIECRDPEVAFVPEIIFSTQSKNGVKIALYK